MFSHKAEGITLITEEKRLSFHFNRSNASKHFWIWGFSQGSKRLYYIDLHYRFSAMKYQRTNDKEFMSMILMTHVLLLGHGSN